MLISCQQLPLDAYPTTTIARPFSKRSTTTPSRGHPYEPLDGRLTTIADVPAINVVIHIADVKLSLFFVAVLGRALTNRNESNPARHLRPPSTTSLPHSSRLRWQSIG